MTKPIITPQAQRAREALDELWAHPHSEPMRSYILGRGDENTTKRINRLRIDAKVPRLLEEEDPR